MKKLSEIRGHDAPLRMMEGARKRGRLASAYLFAGEEGIGKKTAALAFAASLNCREPQEHEGLLNACGSFEQHLRPEREIPELHMLGQACDALPHRTVMVRSDATAGCTCDRRCRHRPTARIRCHPAQGFRHHDRNLSCWIPCGP